MSKYRTIIDFFLLYVAGEAGMEYCDLSIRYVILSSMKSDILRLIMYKLLCHAKDIAITETM